MRKYQEVGGVTSQEFVAVQAILQGMTSPKLRTLSVVLLAGTFLAVAEPDLSARATAPTLPGVRTLIADLWSQGHRGPASLGYRILLPLTLDSAERARIEARARTVPEASNGGTQQTWERELADALGGLVEHERLLLWSLSLEPQLSEGIRSQILRLLDEGRSSPRQLEEVVRGGQGAPAWEAAIRLGRRGGKNQAALREAVADWKGWGRQYAVLGLVLAGDAEALPWIRGAASDASPAVRRHVALALGELGMPRDRATLDAIARRRPDPNTLKAVLHAKARLADRFPSPS